MSAHKVAVVSVSGKKSQTFVPVTADHKPEISEEIIKKWQDILNLGANLLQVPAGLIMRLHEKEIEVFLSSNTENNPYEPHEKAELQTGLYCETVVGNRKELLVPNAKKDPLWENNPDVALNMISYYGVPITWPDGEVFGTFCVLDDKENEYSSDYRQLIRVLHEIIENDLERLLIYEDMKQDHVQKEIQIREIHHRIKNHFNLILAAINLESHFVDPEADIHEILSNIRAKISAISLIHTQLYSSQNIDQIPLKIYMNDLGKQIMKHFSRQNIQFACEGDDDLLLDPKISTPCGLLLSEWITNSIKHAFSETGQPQISINIQVEESTGSVTVSYNDNGKGLPDTLNFDEANSLGMTLIKALTSQLSGALSVKNENGLRYILTFNPKNTISSIKS
jgi:two-component sensor histidine kinase